MRNLQAHNIRRRISLTAFISYLAKHQTGMFFHQRNHMRLQFSFILLIAFILISGCAPTSDKRHADFVNDPHSYANLNDVRTTHISLDLTVDFEAKEIRGTATLDIENMTGADSLILDTDGLAIHEVTLDGGVKTGFTLGARHEAFGAPLAIAITKETHHVTVHYSTGDDAKALQWLDPEQTAGKQKPFLFTQSQAILARSWIPCQDSPGARVTYDARITTRSDLMALMSAKNDTSLHADGIYTFRMDYRIPPYLFALAVGDVRFQSLGPRSGVYAEPVLLEKSAWEFADTEKMIDAAEKLYGPYRWGRYDILVLPPSFPYGGMENPLLTFATPTIIVGDRSLTALVAHELAHSWSGNLVTNRTWNDFWLNEGFTTYFEHRIMESVYGSAYDDMTAQLDFNDLRASIADVGEDSPDTKLKQDLSGRDPDGVMSTVAYEKGFLFLRMCERTIGRERWDPFLRNWFDAYAFKSATTEDFLTVLRDSLIRGDRALEDKLLLDEWVYGTGLPANVPITESTELEKVDQAITQWRSGTALAKLDTRGWVTHHWKYFLTRLPIDMSLSDMHALDKAFQFTKSRNAEIASLWFGHVIEHRYASAYEELEEFLTSMGRRKFVRPLFRKMSVTPEGMALAQRIYKRARPTYHPVTRNTIDKMLGVSS